jgi:hypothetical protein
MYSLTDLRVTMREIGEGISAAQSSWCVYWAGSVFQCVGEKSSVHLRWPEGICMQDFRASWAPRGRGLG